MDRPGEKHGANAKKAGEMTDRPRLGEAEMRQWKRGNGAVFAGKRGENRAL